MPLLEIVGITPVNKNFSVFYGFLENERGTAYDWAFKCIREVLDTDEEIVFVTDKEKALMNAIQKYFPNARHLLCRRHIEKDVEAWVKRVTKNGSRGEAFAKGRWKNLVNSATEAEYLENERICFEKYRLVPGLKKYLKETWLDLYKERFVSAWINNILHFGNVTTNRVEGAHASLKRLLKTSNGGFDTVFETIHNSVKLQIGEIVRELGRSRIIRLHIGVALNVYQRLNLNVSHHAINAIDLALQKAECNNCVKKVTHGLPCACEVIKLLDTDGCIELDSIHQFWKTLDVKTVVGEGVAEKEVEEENRLRKLVDEVIKGGAQSMKKISEYIENMLHPPNIVDPEVKKTRGRPKKTSVSRTPSQWEYVEKEFPTESYERGRSTNTVGKDKEVPKKGRKRGRSNGSVAKEKEIPTKSSTPFQWQEDLCDVMVSWITDWVNVIGDGNCGYRCIALDIYGDENEWLKVRRDLLDELESNKEFYTDIFAGVDNFVALCDRVSFSGGQCLRPYWFDTELLLVAANRYNAIFVSLSRRQSMTCLPTKATNVDEHGPRRIFSMVYLRAAEHFVWVRLGSRSPLPKVYSLGNVRYLNQIQDRLTLYQKQVPTKSNNGTTTIELDDLVGSLMLIYMPTEFIQTWSYAPVTSYLPAPTCSRQLSTVAYLTFLDCRLDSTNFTPHAQV
ncbi:uncharacterized protein LOC141617279 [Silene latifolia]|uniref:uncharacterized protein LOC141617279 n=1 Tax=Silene latifolia TaxID=37657 RepID=UPI003D77EE4A